MALVQNDAGSPVPKRGLRNEIKSGMTIRNNKISNPRSGNFGVGSGTGVAGGGNLGGSKSQSKKK